MRAETLDFVQLNYAVHDRAAEQRLLPLAAERGIAVLVNRPFGSGGLCAGAGGRCRPGQRRSGAELGAGLLKFILAATRRSPA